MGLDVPGEQRGLGHSMLYPCPTGSSSFSLGMQLSPPGCLPVRGSQDTKLGLVMDELDAREPETLQQVSALWTRAGLTEWSGPVHSGHPLWIPGGGAAAPSAHLGLRRWRRNWAVLPTSYPENDKGQFQKWEQGGQSESWVSQGPCEEGFAAAWIPLGWFPFCVVFTSDHKDEAVQVPIASLAQVLTTLLIYYGQGDRVAGVTLPWAREETP